MTLLKISAKIFQICKLQSSIFLHLKLSLSFFSQFIASLWHFSPLVDYYFKFFFFIFYLKANLYLAKDDFIHGALSPLNAHALQLTCTRSTLFAVCECHKITNFIWEGGICCCSLEFFPTEFSLVAISTLFNAFQTSIETGIIS